jgi:hypothetical protein
LGLHGVSLLSELNVAPWFGYGETLFHCRRIFLKPLFTRVFSVGYDPAGFEKGIAGFRQVPMKDAKK